MLIHKVGRSIGGKPKNDIGDVIDQRPDDWTWGVREENNTGFMKLDITGLDNKSFNMENDSLQNPVDLTVMLLDFTDLENVVPLKDKRFKINLAQSGVNPTSEHNTIDVSDLVITDKAGQSTPDNRLTFNTETQEFVKG